MAALHAVRQIVAAQGRADWVRDAARQFADQARLYFGTTLALFADPRGFFTDWADGSRRSLSPLSYYAASLAVLGPITVLIRQQGSSNVIALLLPYFEFIALGLIVHLALKLLAKTQPWPLSLGVALFAGGGPAAIADLSALAVSSFAMHGPVLDSVTAAGILAVNGLFVYVLVSGLSAVHRVRWWRPMLAWAMAALVWSAIKVGVMVSL